MTTNCLRIFFMIFSISLIFTPLNFLVAKAREYDFKPQKIAWIEIDSNNYRLIAYFKNATITTYFRAASNSPQIFARYLPSKQEFLYHPTQQLFNTEKMEHKIWDDNAAGCQFRYDNIALITEDLEIANHILITIDEKYGKIDARYTISVW